MNKQELIKKITAKKEYSQLLKKDVEAAFENFHADKYLDEEKVKLTRDLLRKVFSSFISQKLLSLKNKNEEWILRKHLSTRERLPYYRNIYARILKGLGKKINIIDLGAGVNGFSYEFFEGRAGKYIAVEAIGQLVDLMNDYFKKKKILGKAFHFSLFDIKKVKELIRKQKKPRVIFLFKTIDSLEMLKKDYSTKLISELVPLVDRIVVSFATRSMGKKTRFRAKRSWLINFINENFKITDDFEFGGENYIVFEEKQDL